MRRQYSRGLRFAGQSVAPVPSLMFSSLIFKRRIYDTRGESDSLTLVDFAEYDYAGKARIGIVWYGRVKEVDA